MSAATVTALRGALEAHNNALKEDVLHAVCADEQTRAALQQHVWNLGVIALSERSGIPGATICSVMSGGAVRSSVLNAVLDAVKGEK